MTSIPATVPDGLIECARELLHWTVADTLEELQAQVASSLQTITRCNCLQAARATEIVDSLEAAKITFLNLVQRLAAEQQQPANPAAAAMR